MARLRSQPILALGLLLMTLAGECHGKLQVGYYNWKCGIINVEAVICEVVKKYSLKNKATIANLLRMQFHDCFVRGCDASILLDDPSSEKTATPNRSLGDFDLIEEAKVAVDKFCPGVVSCADIIAISARCAAYMGGANWYEVETGRKDGHISRASAASRDIPGPSTPIHTAIKLFAQKGLSKEDFVVLLGCHTVGTAHCPTFEDRLYNFHDTNTSDPSLNPSLLSSLKGICPRDANSRAQAFLDQTRGSEFKMDNEYYKKILNGRGVLEIDQQMAIDSSTRKIVQKLASNPKLFKAKLGPAMVKMGRIGVLHKGEVRRGTCRRPN